MASGSSPIKLDREILREEIRKEYCEVATNPNRGFHFHTGRTLARITEYPDEWLDNVPEEAVEAFAGTGNPFRIRTLEAGEKVVDIGSGAGIDSFIAANQVGEGGAVIGVDMTPEMLDKANRLKSEAGFDQVAFRAGYMEEIPVEDGWADVVISNGVVNLSPDKALTFAEINRVLRPGGRIQIADILVSRAVSDEAKNRIDLWTG
jgi:SAM-dependent methyltransferase